jgi:hypothetical protein
VLSEVELMSIRLAKLVGVAALCMPVIASAAARDWCYDAKFVPVESLSKLPSEVQVLMGVGKTGTDGMADRDQPYQVGDVILEDLPFRRFLNGAVAPSCVRAVVEFGGRVHSLHQWNFELTNSGWVRRNDMLR